MARYTGPKIKQCRREGMNLFFLGQNTSSGKVAVLQRRDYPPGVHAQSRRKVTEYGVRLREKQKLKRVFGVYEKQFMLYFREAERLKGNTGANMLTLLSRRLDNVVLAAGMATTLAQARQLVNHGHFTVNGKKAHTPSMLVKPGWVIGVRDRSKKSSESAVRSRRWKAARFRSGSRSKRMRCAARSRPCPSVRTSRCRSTSS